MTGSLQVKNDKYYLVLNVYENNRRKIKWITTGLAEKGNKRRAEQLLRNTLIEYEQKQGSYSSDILLSDYIRHWLSIAKRHVDSVTYQGYELMANGQVIPYFEEAQIKLCDISKDILQEYFDEKGSSGRKDGKGGLSPASLRQYKNILNQTLNEAVKNDLLPSNPCQFVELPHKVRFESSFYSATQLQTLFDAITEDPLCPLIRITALYGLRRSEALGLKWDSLDFDNGIVTIKHTVSKVTTAVEKDKTKNASSHRSFPMTEEARRIFEKAKRDEAENRRLFNSQYIENDYIFKWPDGHVFAPDYVSQHFSVLLKRKGLPHIRFHELRHSCASLLLNNGCTLKDVQDWLGHADIQMTANIYGHLDVARKQNMAMKLSQSLNRAC